MLALQLTRNMEFLPRLPGNNFDRIKLTMSKFKAPTNIQAHEEYIIYFDYAGKTKIKTDWIDVVVTSANMVIQFGIPEEISPINANNPFTVTISSRNRIGNAGIKAPNVKEKVWIQIETMHDTPIDYQMLLMQIPGCPFDGGMFDVEVAAWNQNYRSIVHTKAGSTLGIKSSDNEGRIIYEFSTHNELAPAFPEELGFNTAVDTNVRCNGWD